MRSLALAVAVLVVATPLRAQTALPASVTPAAPPGRVLLLPRADAAAAFESSLDQRQIHGPGAPSLLLADASPGWQLHPTTRTRLASEMTGSPSSLSRYLLAGTGIGAVVGAAFGLAVISLADCAGPHCTRERVVGVAGHAVGGAAAGAVVGGIVFLFRR